MCGGPILIHIIRDTIFDMNLSWFPKLIECRDVCNDVLSRHDGEYDIFIHPKEKPEMIAIPEKLILVQDNPYGERYASHGSMHNHWDDFDMRLEGCRFNLLSELMSRTQDEGVRERMIKIARELVALAHSKGYADQDTHMFNLPLNEEPKSYDETIDGVYEEHIMRSMNILKEAVHADDAFLNDLETSMREAIVAGRKMRGGSEPKPFQSSKYRY